MNRMQSLRNYMKCKRGEGCHFGLNLSCTLIDLYVMHQTWLSWKHVVYVGNHIIVLTLLWHLAYIHITHLVLASTWKPTLSICIFPTTLCAIWWILVMSCFDSKATPNNAFPKWWHNRSHVRGIFWQPLPDWCNVQSYNKCGLERSREYTKNVMVWGENFALDFPSYGGLDICHHQMKDCRPSIQLILPIIMSQP